MTRAMTILLAAAAILTGTAVQTTAAQASPAAVDNASAVPAEQIHSAPAELAALDSTWQQLPTDAFGNRHFGSWTIAPDGSRAKAAASASDCASGQTCLFQDANFGGWIRVYTAVNTYNLLSPYDNAMSSWINLNSRDPAWYPNASAGGTKHCMLSGLQVAQVLASENDMASSVHVFSGAC